MLVLILPRGAIYEAMVVVAFIEFLDQLSESVEFAADMWKLPTADIAYETKPRGHSWWVSLSVNY